jgi:uncharacterized protein (TIGR02452 family)
MSLVNKIKDVIKNQTYNDLYLTNVMLDTVIKTNLISESTTTTTLHSLQPMSNLIPCKIKVINNDTLTTAIELNINCILNLGNAYGAGGGAIYGQIAQEEDICRRTTLLQSLSDYQSDKDVPERYIPKCCVLYTPDVYIIKDKYYNDIDYFKCNVITASAVRYNTVHNYSSKDEEIMYNTINCILQTAYIQKNRSIILGALGCGAFKNNPYQCSYLFKKCINNFNGMFDNIVFAVLSYGNNQNYKIFKSILET